MSEKFKVIRANQFPYNPRSITKKKDAQLDETLTRLGDVSGVVYNRRTGNLVAGNQRSRHFDINNAQIQLFYETDKPDAQGTVALGTVLWKGHRYFYREVDWDQPTEKEANIVANKAGGDWDFKILEEHWNTDLLLNAGFIRTELKYLNALKAFQSEETTPIELAKTYTKTGDIYELEGHRIMCGDSTAIEDVKQLFDGQQCHMNATDPPYNVAYNAIRPQHNRKGKKGIVNDAMKDELFTEFIGKFYQNYTAHTIPGGAWYVFHAHVKGHIFMSEFIKAGNYLAQCLVWVKDSKVMGRADYHWQHEPVLYGTTPDLELNKKIAQVLKKELGMELQFYDTYHHPAIYGWRKGGTHIWKSDRSQSTVLQYKRPHVNDLHPTMKPVQMLKYLISNSSEPRQTVADGFLGSGSTLIACEETNRKCFGMELTPKHVDTAIRRWVALRMRKEQTWSVLRNGKDISKQKWLTNGGKKQATTAK